MSSDDERQWGFVQGVPDERVLNAFRDAEPLTTAEVATAAGVSDQTAAAKLVELADDGRVRRKAIGDRDVWFRPVSAFERRDAAPDGGGADGSERSLAAALDELEVPGTSEMMRDWRRDAVRAAFDYLAGERAVEEPAFREDVYPGQSAGYDDPEAWWGMVRPRLKSLPGVDAPTWETETTWEFEEDAVTIDVETSERLQGGSDDEEKTPTVRRENELEVWREEDGQ